MRVFVIEDQERLLELQVALLREAGVEVVGTARTGEEALERIGEARPTVILCDLGLPGIDGTEVTRRVKARWPAIELLVFTVFEEEERVLAAIRAGAAGYLLKGAGAARLVEALRDVEAGGTVIQPNLARLLLRHFQQAPPEDTASGRALTPREGEILQLLGKGLANGEVASVMGISRATVRTHLEHIYDKLDVTNRVEAVAEGIRKGWIEA